MKSFKTNQSGFSVVEVVIVIVVVLGLGAIGYAVYKHTHKAPAKSVSTSTSASSNTNFPSTIKNTADVKQASKALEAQQINTKLNPTQLNGYVQKLL